MSSVVLGLLLYNTSFAFSVIVCLLYNNILEIIEEISETNFLQLISLFVRKVVFDYLLLRYLALHSLARQNEKYQTIIRYTI